ncbi:MAG: nucleotide exchange factor GrpE, partial [Methylococcaceae bacterium]|nr:nucleotide exchange factor GrpE [Methylococcaceae bacterium]
TDLFSLFSELAAMRTEVKAESRQFGNTLDQFKEAQELLRSSQQNLERELDKSRNELPVLRRAALRPLLVEMLDFYDRLVAGQAALSNYRPARGWFRIKSRKEDRAFIQSIRDGQAMTLRRLEETLIRHQVRPIEALGQAVDPHIMTVVELDRQPQLENGLVTAELRKGFLWGEETLRLAEVKANKL